MTTQPGRAPGILSLTLLAPRMALCRLSPTDAVPAWAARARTFMTVSRTPTELSIVADEDALPPELDAVRGYRALRVEGPMPLDLVGVLAALAAPLAASEVAILPIGTYDTDYLFVPGPAVDRAVAALRMAGHVVTVSA